MCSHRTRKVHTVAASVVSLENCPQDARNDEGVDTELFIGELEINTVDGKAWHSKVEVGGTFVEFKLDTGAEANIIPRQIYDNLPMSGKLAWRRPMKYCHRMAIIGLSQLAKSVSVAR